MTKVTLIVPAAGSGSRMKNDIPKTLLLLKGQEILYWTLIRACLVQSIKQIIIPVKSSNKLQIEKLVEKVVFESNRKDIDWEIVDGGSERMYSINNCIHFIHKNTEIVAVHDAVRPFFNIEAFDKCIENANENGASVLGLPLRETIKKVDNQNLVINTPNRTEFWSIQTPQCFTINVFKKAYQKAVNEEYFGTDDASLVENAGYKVHVTEGNSENIKITYPIDLKLAELLLKEI